jgi:hypothetical protein
MMVIGSLALMGSLLTGFTQRPYFRGCLYYTSIGYFSYCLGTMGAFFTAFLFSKVALLNFYVETIRLSSSYLL